MIGIIAFCVGLVVFLGVIGGAWVVYRIRYTSASHISVVCVDSMRRNGEKWFVAYSDTAGPFTSKSADRAIAYVLLRQAEALMESGR